MDKEAPTLPPMDDLQLFNAKVPWITSTPQSRVQIREVTVPGENEIPPPPILPKPPQAPVAPLAQVNEKLSEEEQQLLKHLRGLKELSATGIEIPASMMETLQHLEAREKEASSSRPLTHGHLNQLKKMQNQVNAAARKIHTLDKEWRAFVTQAASRLQAHSECYAACRADHIQVYQQKVKDLEEAKKQVQVASASLVQDVPEPEVPPEQPDVTSDLSHFQALAVAANETSWPIAGDLAAPMEDEMEKDADEVEVIEANHHKRPSLAAFGRAATSPGKVANHALKVKQEDTKENKTKK